MPTVLAPNPDLASPLHLSPALAGIPMTAREFDAAASAEQGYRYELVRGILIVTPPPDMRERGPNDLLGAAIRQHAQDHGLDRQSIYTAPEQTVYLDEDRRRPDRVIWIGLDRAPKPREDFPDIIVEFVSPGRRAWRRDYQEKQADYLNAGVKEYWIIDRFDQSLTVVTHQDGVRVYAKEQPYQPPLLPGFVVPLKQMLDEADWFDR